LAIYRKRLRSASVKIVPHDSKGASGDSLAPFATKAQIEFLSDRAYFFAQRFLSRSLQAIQFARKTQQATRQRLGFGFVFPIDRGAREDVH
jgi:hypothetical protein